MIINFFFLKKVAKHDISQFDASKVDVMSIHEQAALNVSSAESKYHKM